MRKSTLLCALALVIGSGYSENKPTENFVRKTPISIGKSICQGETYETISTKNRFKNKNMEDIYKRYEHSFITPALPIANSALAKNNIKGSMYSFVYKRGKSVDGSVFDIYADNTLIRQGLQPNQTHVEYCNANQLDPNVKIKLVNRNPNNGTINYTKEIMPAKGSNILAVDVTKCPSNSNIAFAVSLDYKQEKAVPYVHIINSSNIKVSAQIWNDGFRDGITLDPKQELQYKLPLGTPRVGASLELRRSDGLHKIYHYDMADLIKEFSQDNPRSERLRYITLEIRNKEGTFGKYDVELAAYKGDTLQPVEHEIARNLNP